MSLPILIGSSNIYLVFRVQDVLVSSYHFAAVIILIIVQSVSILFPVTTLGSTYFLFHRHPYARNMHEYYLVTANLAKSWAPASPIFTIKNLLKALTISSNLAYTTCSWSWVMHRKKKFLNSSPFYRDYESLFEAFPMYPNPSAFPRMPLWDHLHSDGRPSLTPRQR